MAFVDISPWHYFRKIHKLNNFTQNWKVYVFFKVPEIEYAHLNYENHLLRNNKHKISLCGDVQLDDTPFFVTLLENNTMLASFYEWWKSLRISTLCQGNCLNCLHYSHIVGSSILETFCFIRFHRSAVIYELSAICFIHYQICHKLSMNIRHGRSNCYTLKYEWVTRWSNHKLCFIRIWYYFQPVLRCNIFCLHRLATNLFTACSHRLTRQIWGIWWLRPA